MHVGITCLLQIYSQRRPGKVAGDNFSILMRSQLTRSMTRHQVINCNVKSCLNYLCISPLFYIPMHIIIIINTYLRLKLFCNNNYLYGKNEEWSFFLPFFLHTKESNPHQLSIRIKFVFNGCTSVRKVELTKIGVQY